MKRESKMRTGVLIGIVLLLISALLVGACAKAPAPATPAPGTPAATPTPAVSPTPAAAPVIKLKFADTTSITDTGYTTVTKKWFLAEMTKRSGGRIQFDEFWGGALAGSNPEMVELLGKGTIDIGGDMCPTCGTESYFPFEFPGNSILFSIKTPLEAIRIGRWMNDNLPFFQAMPNALGMKMMTQDMRGPYGIWTKVPVNKIADMKGLKIYVWGGEVPNLIKAVDGVPVGINPVELYDNVKTGVLSGGIKPLDWVHAGKGYEVGKYWVATGFGGVIASPSYMNLKRLNSLPDDLRQIVEQVMREAEDVEIAEYFKQNQVAKDYLIKAGVTLSELTPADVQTWRAAYNPEGTGAKWAEKIEKERGQKKYADQTLATLKEKAAAGWAIPGMYTFPDWVWISPVTGKDIRTYLQAPFDWKL